MKAFFWITRGLQVCAFMLIPGPFALSDTFRILDDDRESAQARVDLIQQAKKSIDVEYFIYGDDAIAIAGLALLRDAARRGVRVRLLVDGLFHSIPSHIQALLIQEGVSIKVYHPLLLHRFYWLFYRLHDKMVLCDDTQMILGGRNMKNQYFGRRKSWNYLDRDVYVRGKASLEASAYFDKLWNSREVRSVSLPFFSRQWRERDYRLVSSPVARDFCKRAKREAPLRLMEAERILDDSWKNLESGEFMQLHTGYFWWQGQKNVDVHFLHDPIGQKGSKKGINGAFLELFTAARQEILIETPYLVPSRQAMKAMRGILAKDVIVQIHTNSLSSSDNILTQAGYNNVKADLVRMGADIREYKGPQRMHAKSAVIDDRIAIVGSYNFDPRSQYLDTQLAVWTEDPEIAAELKGYIVHHMENAYRIDPKGMPLGEKERFPGVPFCRIIQLRILQILAPLLHQQL